MTSNELIYLDQRRDRLLDELREVEQRKQQLLTQAKEEPEEIEVPRMLTIKAAASELGLSYDFLWKLCRQGKIIYVKAGRKYLVNMRCLCRYLNQGEM